MQYGYFDDANKEYVIQRPDTPDPGAIIWVPPSTGPSSPTTPAATVSFARQPEAASCECDLTLFLPISPAAISICMTATAATSGPHPGSRSESPRSIQSVCRHGTAYSIIESDTAVSVRKRPIVPLGRHLECWLQKIINRDKVRRRLRLFTLSVRQQLASLAGFDQPPVHSTLCGWRLSTTS